MGSGASTENVETLKNASQADLQKLVDDLSSDCREKLTRVLASLGTDVAAKDELEAAWKNLAEMIEQNPELVEENDAMSTPPPSVAECEAILCKLCKVETRKDLWKADSPSDMGAALLTSMKNIDADSDGNDIKLALDAFVSEGKCGKLGAASMLFGGIGTWLQALNSYCAGKSR